MRTRAIARLLALLALLAGPAAARRHRAVVSIAHRGASGYAPEHTVAAYDLAVALGADYLEQDLQLTRDGVLVILHDATLDRTARGPAENCTGAVADKTLAQIETCDVGTSFNEANPERARPEYVGLRIPTLDEVFTRYGRRMNYYVETKSPETADHMEDRLLALLDALRLRRPAARRRRVVIQSFSAASLQTIHAIDPSLPLVQLVLVPGTGTALETSLDQIAGYAIGIGPVAGFVDAALVAAAHARCLDVHPWTVNDPDAMAGLLALGVDGMFTNFPDLLDRLLGPDALRPKRAARLAARRHRRCVRRAAR
jgi:glycerophosphoryl diester phosphodiesterase